MSPRALNKQNGLAESVWGEKAAFGHYFWEGKLRFPSGNTGLEVAVVVFERKKDESARGSTRFSRENRLEVVVVDLL